MITQVPNIKTTLVPYRTRQYILFSEKVNSSHFLCLYGGFISFQYLPNYARYPSFLIK